MPLAAIGTGLKVLGGLKGLFGGGGPGPMDQSYLQLKGAFKAADEAGLHRLAVAGSPAGYSPVPSGEAEGLLNAGQALRDHSQSKADKASRAKENELIDAQIEEARSRTILNQANARRAMMGPQPGLGGASSRLNDLLSAHRDRVGGPRGVRVEPEADVPMTGTTNVGGTTMVNPNEEAFSVGIDELLVGALLYGPQWLAAQTRRLGERSRQGATEPKGREAARTSARETQRRANESSYLGVRRQ